MTVANIIGFFIPRFGIYILYLYLTLYISENALIRTDIFISTSFLLVPIITFGSYLSIEKLKIEKRYNKLTLNIIIMFLHSVIIFVILLFLYYFKLIDNSYFYFICLCTIFALVKSINSAQISFNRFELKNLSVFINQAFFWILFFLIAIFMSNFFSNYEFNYTFIIIVLILIFSFREIKYSEKKVILISLMDLFNNKLTIFYKSSLVIFIKAQVYVLITYGVKLLLYNYTSIPQYIIPWISIYFGIFFALEALIFQIFIPYFKVKNNFLMRIYFLLVILLLLIIYPSLFVFTKILNLIYLTELTLYKEYFLIISIIFTSQYLLRSVFKARYLIIKDTFLKIELISLLPLIITSLFLYLEIKIPYFYILIAILSIFYYENKNYKKLIAN